jgi:PhnB protein
MAKRKIVKAKTAKASKGKAAKAAPKKKAAKRGVVKARAAKSPAKARSAAKRAPRRPAAQPAVRAALPYLCCKNASGAIEFYKKGFGAEELMRMTGPDGTLGHAEVSIEGTRVMLADEHPQMGHVSPETLNGTPVGIVVEVRDVDATFERALGAGAVSLQPPTDQPWGDRMGTLRDPYGHRWSFFTKLEDVSKDELERRMGGAYKVS